MDILWHFSGMVDEATRKRFLAKFDQGKPDECWLWKAAIGNGTGYGIMGLNGVSTGAHRISWLVFRGEIPDGLWVLHNCPGGDERRCVNPNHLFLGTQDDNNKDAAKKGRTPKGTKHWNARLSEENISEIFHFKAQGYSYPMIGALFGISKCYVWEIINGRRRKRTA